jgi:hypothetical protein
LFFKVIDKSVLKDRKSVYVYDTALGQTGRCRAAETVVSGREHGQRADAK